MNMELQKPFVNRRFQFPAFISHLLKKAAKLAVEGVLRKRAEKCVTHSDVLVFVRSHLRLQPQNELRSMRLAHAGRVDRALNCSASRVGCVLRNQSARRSDSSYTIAERRGCHHAVAEVRMRMAGVLLIMPASGLLTEEGQRNSAPRLTWIRECRGYPDSESDDGRSTIVVAVRTVQRVFTTVQQSLTQVLMLVVNSSIFLPSAHSDM